MILRCTDHLILEHRVILRAIYVLEAMADRAKKGNLPEAMDVERLLWFFRRFGDGHHQAKEETVLFPALRNTDAGRKGGPLQRMMFEHEQERSLLEGLEESLRTRNPIDFAYFGHRLADVLTTHIYKEDNILFDFARSSISPEMDARLLKEMERFDEESLGADMHREMDHTVLELERKYLNKAA